MDDNASPMRSERYLAEYLDVTDIGFVYFDVRGVVRDCNTAIARLLHTTTDQLIGLRLGSMVRLGASLSFAFDDPAAARAFDGTRIYRGAVVGFVFPDEPRRWLAVDSYPIVSDGQLRGVVATLTDMTAARTSERMLRLMADVTRTIATSPSQDDALQSFVDRLASVGEFTIAWVTVESERGGVVAHRAGEVAYLDEVSFEAPPDAPIWRGPTLRAIGTQQPVAVDVVARDADLSPWHERAAYFGIESFVALPLSLGRQRGALTIAAKDKFAFDAVVLAELRALVAEVELLVAHSRTRAELERSLRGTVSAMVRLTEIRDPYTAGHQARVSSLSRRLAEQLGWGADDVDLVSSAAALHDVGKIAVPSEILGRPGALSALEFEAVARHAELGAEIVDEASLSSVYVDVARHHHERLDGSGYPDGLADGAISPYARVVAVADVVEAMVHHRPYRPAWSLADAREELRGGSGVLYDSAVAEACMSLIDEGFVFEASSDSGPSSSGLTAPAGTASEKRKP